LIIDNLKSSASEKGAALVEFALISGVLILLLAGIIQVGLVISAKLSLENITHMGARYAASPLNVDNDAAIKAYIISGADLTLSESDITITPTTRLPGDSSRVKIIYVYHVPVTLGVFPAIINLTSTATMMQN
jgi:Flp pilus assembly protein TadG